MYYNVPYVMKLYVVWSIVLVAGKGLSYRYHCCEIQLNWRLDGFAIKDTVSNLETSKHDYLQYSTNIAIKIKPVQQYNMLPWTTKRSDEIQSYIKNIN